MSFSRERTAEVGSLASYGYSVIIRLRFFQLFAHHPYLWPHLSGWGALGGPCYEHQDGEAGKSPLRSSAQLFNSHLYG